MLKFFAVLVAGSIGGWLCGFLISLPAEVHNNTEALAPWTDPFILAAQIGLWVGAPLGLIAFSVAYYSFLRRVSLLVALDITVPSAIVAGWLGHVVELPPTAFQRDIAGLLVLYGTLLGPALAGLFLSSLITFAVMNLRNTHLDKG